MAANQDFFYQIANENAPLPGIVGEGWATTKVEVSQTEERLHYYVRGSNAATTGDPRQPPAFVQIIDSELYDTEGPVNFGLDDPYPGAPPIDNILDQFALYDNLLVVGSNPIPEPRSGRPLILMVAVAAFGFRRHRQQNR